MNLNIILILSLSLNLHHINSEMSLIQRAYKYISKKYPGMESLLKSKRIKKTDIKKMEIFKCPHPAIQIITIYNHVYYIYTDKSLTCCRIKQSGDFNG